MNTSANLLEKIKHKLLSMDLFTQMDKAKELTNFALTHQAISREEKLEFTCWLQSMSNGPCGGLFDSNMAAASASSKRSSSDRMASGPPQVTISGVSGHIVQYNALSSPISERTSRPWRSNSLTPPATDQHLSASPTDHWCQYQNKGRSHSLTYVRDSTTSEASISPASSVSMIEEKEVEEIVKTLPEGCGMKDIREWLKSLRLHKYTKLLLEYSYEEFLELTDEKLERRNVTLGARGKIIKNIGLIKERPQKLVQLAKELEDVSQSNDSDGLAKIICDLEAIVLMPLKPTPLAAGSTPNKYPNSRMRHSNPEGSGGNGGRHDSGSDSGTEHDQLDGGVDVPAQIFEILKSISTEIFVKEYTNHQVVTVFACLLEKCSKREAYSSSQKYLMINWLSKLKTLWNPPQIKKATDYKKRPYNNRASTDPNPVPTARRLSIPRNPPNQVQPQPHQQPQQQVQPQQQLTPTSPLYNPMYNALQIPFAAESAYFSPRRSMPEIKAKNNSLVSQMKRNSYQEESKFNLDGLHYVTNGLYNGFQSQTDTRRESSISTDSGYLMSLPESRRDSEVDTLTGNAYKPGPHFRRDDFLDSFNSTSQKVPKPNFGGTQRRDSDNDFLTVESAFSLGGVGNPARGCHQGSSVANTGLLCPGFLKNPGSMSSGCASDGSTDSLLEQDLHNLSLSVTQQALE